jgi:hypothetical protein
MPRQIEHIQIRRLWSYVHLQNYLNETERAHLSDCDRCLDVFRLCVVYPTVDQVEKELDADRQQSA